MLCRGSLFDRYTIEALLGEGGMGRVYRAYDPRLDRPIALKILRADATLESQGAARILREARAAAGLRHAYAVAVYDVGEHDGQPFIAMELIEGRSLRALIGDLSVPVALRLRWLLEIARVLVAAHERGLVHRDVKPENVLIDEGGSARVLDFGIARRVRPDDAQLAALATLTHEGTVVGTPLYMAPEQLHGEEIDARADQFAWGVVAYELLCGASPWNVNGGAFAVASQILTHTPPPLSERAPDVPAAATALVARAMAKAPSRRFASMSDVVRSLEPLAASLASDREERLRISPAATTLAGRPTPMEAPDVADGGSAVPSSKPRRNRARVLWLASVAASVIVAIAVVIGVRRGERAGQTRVAAASASATSESVVTLADLPHPKAANATALSEYLRALVAIRGASMSIAYKRLDAALAADPLMAAAHLRYAIYIIELATFEKHREHYKQATTLRASLDERDRAILDAFEPYFRDDSGRASPETAARLAALAARSPNDAELAYLATTADRTLVDALERTVALDPHFALALSRRAHLEQERGDEVAAKATLARCLEAQPDAIDCRVGRLDLEADFGECVAMESDARNLLTARGESYWDYLLLADAMFAQGRDLSAVRDALSQGAASLPEPRRARYELAGKASADILSGDFRAADAHLAELERLIGALALSYHFEPPGITRIKLALESGDRARAGRLADELLKRRGARRDDEDPRPFLYAVATRAGLRTPAERDAQRAEWIASSERDTVPHWRWLIWMDGYAQPAETRDEAEEAMRVRPTFPAFGGYNRLIFHTPEIFQGKMLVLTGEYERAVTLLRPQAKSCYAAAAPLARTHVWSYLGDALAGTNDLAGACQAYGVVVARWGHAIPRSVTAEHARAQRSALKCAP